MIINMKKYLIINFIFLVILFTACSKNNTQQDYSTVNTLQEIDEGNFVKFDVNKTFNSTIIGIQNWQFTSKNLDIVKGTSVIWKNYDYDINYGIILNGTEVEIRPGEEYTYTFTEVGQYIYQSVEDPMIYLTINVVESLDQITINNSTEQEGIIIF